MGDSYKIYASQDYVDEKVNGKMTSWNDLADRPFGEEKTVIEWDGETANRDFCRFVSGEEDVTDSLQFKLYKVSDVVLTVEQLGLNSDTPAILTDSDGNPPREVEEEYFLEIMDFIAYAPTPAGIAMLSGESGVYEVSGMSMTVPSSGTYFAMYSDQSHVTSLTTASVITQLDPKFIPLITETITEIVPETNITFVDSMYGGHYAELGSGSEYWGRIVEGNTYRVTIDSSVYVLTAQRNDVFGESENTSSAIYLGDSHPIDGVGLTNLGFSVGITLGVLMLRINQDIFTVDPSVFKLELIDTAIKEGYIPDTIARIDSTIPTPTTAAVGQTIVVKAVDATGKPTEWKMVDIERPSMTQITLTTANWDDTTKSQTITVTGILADTTAQNIQINPIPTNMHYAVESGLYCSAQAANSLTFSCSVIPIEDITLNVVWQDVNYIS